MFVFQLIKDIFREFCVFCARLKKGRGKGGHGMPCPYAGGGIWRLLRHQRIYVGIELGGLADDSLEDTAFGIKDDLRGITFYGIAGCHIHFPPLS